MKTVFLIVLSAFYAENGAFLMAFHNFKSISHRFSKQFHMLFYCFAEYSRQGETFSYYGFKAYRRCNHVILKMIGYKMDIRVLRADISIFSYKQGRRIKNYCSVKVVTNIFHPIRLLVFSDSYFLLLFYPSLVW